MEIRELNELAKTYEQSILSSNLTAVETVALLGILDSRIKRKLFEAMPVAPFAPSIEKPNSITPPKKSIHYDPYDPPPPMDSDPLPPPQEISPSKVLANEGYACVCAMCSKHIFTVNRVIKEGCTVGEFIESFTPMPGYSKLDRTYKISNVEGNITTNCPGCNGELCLYLTGKRAY